MIYYPCINSGEINPFVKEVLILILNLQENVILTWHTFAKEIFSEFQMDKSEYENYDRPFILI